MTINNDETIRFIVFLMFFILYLEKETNSNYGFNIPSWDYLFRTYKNQPEKGHLGMTIGLGIFRKL